MPKEVEEQSRDSERNVPRLAVAVSKSANTEAVVVDCQRRPRCTANHIHRSPRNVINWAPLK